MLEHHQRAIANLVDKFRADDDCMAVIVSGSGERTDTRFVRRRDGSLFSHPGRCRAREPYSRLSGKESGTQFCGLLCSGRALWRVFFRAGTRVEQLVFAGACRQSGRSIRWTAHFGLQSYPVPCHKSLMKALEQAPPKPEGYMDLQNRMLTAPSVETIGAFTSCVREFHDWGITSHSSVSRFIVNNEWNWLDHEPPLADR